MSTNILDYKLGNPGAILYVGIGQFAICYTFESS